MNKIFDMDSPLIKELARIGDLILVNIAACLFFVPFMAAFYNSFIVVSQRGYSIAVGILPAICLLPAGMAIASVNYVALKMVRREEGYVLKNFIKGIKDNAISGTKVWGIFTVVIFFLASDYCLIYFKMIGSKAVLLAVVVGTILAAGMMIYSMALTSHFTNTTGETIKNSLILNFMHLPITLMMIVVCSIPPVMFMIFGVRILPLIIILGISGPAYICALMYNKIFKQLEGDDDE